MPGIFGVLDPVSGHSSVRQSELVGIVHSMRAAMSYEPFYTHVVVSSPALAACVGRVGLPSEHDHSVGIHEADSFALMAGDGASDSSSSRPGSTVQDLRLGMDHPLRGAANGPLSGACAAFMGDALTGQRVLMNDRYGRERIFIYSDGSRTYFASEAKAILAVAPATREFEPTGLAEFLACGCTLGSRSLFRDIEVLGPGTQVMFDTRGGLTRRTYYASGEMENLEPMVEADFVHEFSESLRAAVNDAMAGSEKAAISLTGGLDSRMILACVDADRRDVACYTFGSMFRTTADVAIAARVAQLAGHPHHVLPLDNGFLHDVCANVESAVYISDGYLGLSGAAELYLNRLARRIAPVRITGNWGGELMRGVRAFKYVPPKGDFIVPELASRISESAGSFKVRSANPLSAALFQQLPYQGFGRYAIERSQLAIRSPFLADAVIRALYRAPASTYASSRARDTVIGRRPDLLAVPTDLGLLGHPSSLRRAWRRALAKAEYLTSHGAPNWLARVSACLPAATLETRFLGVDKFQHFRYWLRHDLASFVRTTLVDEVDSDLGQWFDLKRIARLVRDHAEGRGNYTDEIDKLLTVAIAHRKIIKANTRDGGAIEKEIACRACHSRPA